MDNKAPLTGHRMELDGKIFELVGARHEKKGQWLYLLEFIEDVPAQEPSEPSSRSEDFPAKLF